MTKIDKLIQKLKSKPKNFTFDEAEKLLQYFSFTKSNKGKTSGSRVLFSNGISRLLMYKPHPINELKTYQIAQLLTFLEKEGLI